MDVIIPFRKKNSENNKVSEVERVSKGVLSSDRVSEVEQVSEEVLKTEGFDSVEEYYDSMMLISRAERFWASLSDSAFAYELRNAFGVPKDRIGEFRKNILQLRSDGLKSVGLSINPVFIEGEIPDEGYFNKNDVQT